ncbi:MAG: hypothetical protein WBV83_01660, partial [Bradyrhizobium sp.]|uniref:hypothetical protein n=1 Tax=Bradyrhizobium sp. TaxID=376 RepID=UPI003C627DBD
RVCVDLPDGQINVIPESRAAAIRNPFVKTTSGKMDSGFAFQAPRNDDDTYVGLIGPSGKSDHPNSGSTQRQPSAQPHRATCTARPNADIDDRQKKLRYPPPDPFQKLKGTEYDVALIVNWSDGHAPEAWTSR